MSMEIVLLLIAAGYLLWQYIICPNSSASVAGVGQNAIPAAFRVWPPCGVMA